MRMPAREDRGAVAILMAAVVMVLVLIAAFAVDLGMQRVARRDMQSLSDVVALDLVRELDGTRTVAQLTPLMPGLARQSQKRNESTLGGIPDLKVELGKIDPSGAFVVQTGNAVPVAVRVTSTTSVGFAFVPGSGGAARSAVSTHDAIACFRLGSYALSVNSGNSALLNGLIGDALNIGVLGYDGLANANITLLGLATELGVGTVDELLALPALSVGNLAVAAAEVLQNQGGETADITLLNSIPINVGQLPNITVGQLLGLAPGDNSALDASFNVLDLIAGAAFIANGQNLLSIPNLAVNLGLLGTGLTSSLSIIDAPRRKCGPINTTQVDTAQTTLDLNGSLLNPPAVLGLAVKVGVNLHAQLASGSGILRKIVCNDGSTGGSEGVDVEVQNALTQVALTLNVNLKGDLGLVKVEINVPVTAKTDKSFASNTAVVRVPPLAYVNNSLGAYTTPPVPTGAGSVGLSGLAISGTPTITATLLGIPVALPIPIGNILNALLSGVVNPLIGNVDQLLLGPLTDLLGLEVAGSDVFGIAHPSCTLARLVG
jgi:uncharacterized membrane protein